MLQFASNSQARKVNHAQNYCNHYFNPISTFGISISDSKELKE